MKNYLSPMMAYSIAYLLTVCIAAHAVPEAPCKKVYDSCWCATQRASTQGICVPSLSGKGVYCSCMIVEKPDEVTAHQKRLFQNAAPELFYNPGGSIPMQERKQKGAAIKANLAQQLSQGKITYYSTKIPIGARLNTDYGCSQTPNYSCNAFKHLLTDGKLGASYLHNNTLPMPIFNTYNNAVTQICDEIQGGNFIKADISTRKGFRSAPQATINILTSPCLRFIDILQRAGLPATAKEKAAINAICATSDPQETMANNDPCVCGDQRQPKSLKPGLCQVNKVDSTDTLSCHCED